jgi:hypothetical protein
MSACAVCGRRGTIVPVSDPSLRATAQALVWVYPADMVVWMPGDGPASPVLACHTCRAAARR